MKEICLLAGERLAPLAALYSLRLLNYLFHCWRLLVHLFVISELYTCEEQRYLSVSYQDDKFLIKNIILTVTLIFVSSIFTVKVLFLSDNGRNLINKVHLFVIVPYFPFKLLALMPATNCLQINIWLTSRPHPWSSINSSPLDVWKTLRSMFLFIGVQSG